MQASQIYPTASNTNTIVTTVDETYYRYFNGRRYYTSKEMQHFLTPGKPENNFWQHRIFVAFSPLWPHRKTRKTRYSQTSGR